MSIFVQESHNFHTGFILATIVVCFIYRFLGTFLLSALVNLGRVHKIQMKEQIIMGYGGLRGAVGFSLAVVLSQVDFYIP
jgi:NhaP-type Na+/H+ or K+/H+ antiporter